MNTQEGEQEALDLRAYLRPIWRRKWIILLIVVIAAAATYFLSSRQQKQYAASTRLFVQVADPTQNIISGTQGSPSTASLADVAQLATSQSVTDAVSQRLRMPVSSAGSVTATPQTGSDFIVIAATSHRPALAARLANTYVSVFLRNRTRAIASLARHSQRLGQAQLASLPASSKNPNVLGQREALLQQIQSYGDIANNPSPGSTQVDQATAPSLPVSPHPTRDAIFGGLIGLILGVIVAFFLELLDRRLARVAAVESAFGRPILSVLPHVSRPTPVDKEKRPVVPVQFAEGLRSLTVMLRLGDSAGAPRTIMITSTAPREGKSTVTRDLALVYAESGQSVLVIDGDLRRPSMERLFSIEANQGLVQILRGEASLSEVAVAAVGTRRVTERSTNSGPPATTSGPANTASPSHHGPVSAGWFGYHRSNAPARAAAPGSPTSIVLAPVDPEPPEAVDPGLPGSVDVVTHGERLQNPLPLLASKRMVTLFEEASKGYDIVLLDTPPMLAVADSLPLMEVVDSVLLVVRLGQTTRHSADRFKELVGRLPNVNFSGVIANDQREKRDDEEYGSYGSYGYGVSGGAKPKRASTSAS